MTQGQKVTADLPVGEGLVLPYHDLGPSEQSPRVALVGGLMADEFNAVFVLSRLAAFLRNLGSEPNSAGFLKGRVIIFPAPKVLRNGQVAATGAAGGAGHSEQIFPGHAAGSLPARVGHGILSMSARAYYRIHVQCADAGTDVVPQVGLYQPSDDERATACLIGLPAVVEHDPDTLDADGLDYAWRAVGAGESFSIRAGSAGGLQGAHCEVLFRGLLAFLDRSGVVQGLTLGEVEDDLHYFGRQQTFPIVSDCPGLFISARPIGGWVQAGDLIGQVFDPMTGERRADLHAPVAGLIGALRTQPELNAGGLVARVLKPTEGWSGVDADVVGGA